MNRILSGAFVAALCVVISVVLEGRIGLVVGLGVFGFLVGLIFDDFVASYANAIRQIDFAFPGVTSVGLTVGGAVWAYFDGINTVNALMLAVGAVHIAYWLALATLAPSQTYRTAHR